MNVEKVLQNVGFSPNEIKVYLTLNEQGSTTAGKTSKLAKIDRSSCYNSLKLLQEKGFVSYAIIGKVKWFQVTGPKRILEYVNEQAAEVKHIIPLLEQKHKAVKEEGQVRLFKGIKGVKSIFLDIARTKKDNYVFGSEGQFSKLMPEFATQFDRLKRENNIKTRMILRKGRSEKDKKTSTYRYIDVDESTAVTNIYGDKIAIVIWTKEPEGIIIENAAAAKAYKSYFDIMWKSSQPKLKK